MFVKISNPPTGTNKGSSAKLVEYLNKEEGTNFFDRQNKDISKTKVKNGIDKNIGGLKRGEDKFYMLSINPSHRELEHLIGRKINNFEELTLKEKEKLFEKLESYTHDVMDEYAKNYHRDNVKDGKDLLYFAKIETEREYKHYDKECNDGTKRPGDKKDGLNVHVHVIVSRKSKDGAAKLAPNGRFLGAKWERDGVKVQRGFNHTEFKDRCIDRFCEKYNYNPNQKERGNYKSVQGNIQGSIQGKVKGKIKQEVFQGNFRQEEKAISAVKETIQAVSNPAAFAKKKVIQEAKKLVDFFVGQGKKL